MVCKRKDKRDVYLIATNNAGGDVVKHVRRKHSDVDLAVLAGYAIYLLTIHPYCLCYSQ